MKKIISHSKKPWKIVLFIVIFLLLAGGTCYFLCVKNSKTTKNDEETTESTPQVTDQPQTLRISAMGDMLAHDTIIANAKIDNGYDFAHYFTNIKQSYADSDLVFCNQEGLSSGESYGISGYPTFNAPTQFAIDLSSVGCNVINLANNHMGDKGANAVNATLDVWAGLKPKLIAGANKSADDQKKISLTEVNGLKIAFLAFADFNNNKSIPSYSVNLYDTALVTELVSEARQTADVVLVSMHWGIEDSTVVSATQKSEVSLLASLGVDVIIGTGPHVLQPVEIVDRPDGGKMTVWYSLGNMLSSQLKVIELIGGIASFDITKDENNKIIVDNLAFVPTYMHYEWTKTEEANSDLLARKNVNIYLLSEAAEPLSRSLLNTTVDEQKAYFVKTIANNQVSIK